MHFVEQKINFSKNETELKMENPTHSFRETNLVIQPIKETQIKNKTDQLELAKEKRGHLLHCLFCPEGTFFKFVFYLSV